MGDLVGELLTVAHDQDLCGGIAARIQAAKQIDPIQLL